MNDQATLEAVLRGADAAIGRGDAAGARAALEAHASDGGSLAFWMKLASLRRAAGEFSAALEAVGRALAFNPLDFVALLSKAMLLDQLGLAGAGDAYGHALAQQPDGALPSALARMVERAEAEHARHLERREAAYAAAMVPAAEQATPDEIRRFARFRSNVLRRTRVFHSEPTHFHYPGLAEREFHDRAEFDWLSALEAETDAITADFERVVAAEHAELVPYVDYPADVPMRQWAALNRSRDWTAIHLLRRGERIEANARHCPATMALLDRLPQPVISGATPNAMFSLLAPGAHIPPHTGVANVRLVCHLPLVVPEGCWFRVGDETRAWRRGEAFVFDDTIEHEAANEGSELRVVLIIDAWHPGLSPAEREGVAALVGIGADGAGGAF